MYIHVYTNTHINKYTHAHRSHRVRGATTASARHHVWSTTTSSYCRFGVDATTAAIQGVRDANPPNHRWNNGIVNSFDRYKVEFDTYIVMDMVSWSRIIRVHSREWFAFEERGEIRSPNDTAARVVLTKFRGEKNECSIINCWSFKKKKNHASPFSVSVLWICQTEW